MTADAVIVTGGASGIGQGVVRRLNGAYTTYIFDKNVEAGERAYQLDVTAQEEVSEAVADVFKRQERVRGLVNVAGVTWVKPLLEVTPREWHRILDVNLSGTFFCMQAVAQQLVRSGRPGCVVNVTSLNAVLPIKGVAAYCAAKAGATQLTRAAALELAAYGIRVNAVAPGAVDTPMMAPVLERAELRQAFLDSIPLGRVGQPTDIAAMVEFLLSPDAEWITGQLFIVDGGMSLVGEPSLATEEPFHRVEREQGAE
jgi:NAD(P)-dependent dehydrogenase (short-subunit alcohol dehydrogenase family)